MKNEDKVALEDELAVLLIERFNVKFYDICLLSDFNDDLGLDSLDKIEYNLQVENKYNILISNEDSGDLKTFGDLVIYVYNLLSDED